MDDSQYLKAIEMAIGAEFFWDSWYWPTDMQERINEFRSYHQRRFPHTTSTDGLCRIYLSMRTQEILTPGSTLDTIEV